MHGGLGSSQQHREKTEHDSHFDQTVLGNVKTDQEGQCEEFQQNESPNEVRFGEALTERRQDD